MERIGQEERALPLPIICSPLLPPPPLLMSRGRGGGWQLALQGRLASFGVELVRSLGTVFSRFPGFLLRQRSCNFLGHFNISLRISMKPRFILFLGIGLSSGYFLYSSFVKPSYILGPLEFTTLYHPQLKMPIGDY